MAIGQHVAKALAAKEPKTEDPTVSEAPASVTQSDFLAAMQMLIAEIRGGNKAPEDKERLALEAERLLLEQERLKREMPENKTAPGISVYSNPRGERDDPKPALKCKFYWCGPEERPEVLTPEEIILRNKLQPGDYRVTKSNGARINFKVTAQYKADGGVESLSVWFPCKKGDDRHDHRSNLDYLREVLGEKVQSAEELMAEVAKLRKELATAQAVIEAA